MRVGRVRPHEASVEVDHRRGGERIELGGDARHRRRHDRGEHDAHQADRQVRRHKRREHVIDVTVRAVAGHVLHDGGGITTHRLERGVRLEETCLGSRLRGGFFSDGQRLRRLPTRREIGRRQAAKKGPVGSVRCPQPIPAYRRCAIPVAGPRRQFPARLYAPGLHGRLGPEVLIASTRPPRLAGPGRGDCGCAALCSPHPRVSLCSSSYCVTAVSWNSSTRICSIR